MLVCSGASEHTHRHACAHTHTAILMPVCVKTSHLHNHTFWVTPVLTYWSFSEVLSEYLLCNRSWNAGPGPDTNCWRSPGTIWFLSRSSGLKSLTEGLWWGLAQSERNSWLIFSFTLRKNHADQIPDSRKICNDWGFLLVCVFVCTPHYHHFIWV